MTEMPYQIHVEKTDPRTGGLMPEGEPLEIVETKDDAKKALQGPSPTRNNQRLCRRI